MGFQKPQIPKHIGHDYASELNENIQGRIAAKAILGGIAGTRALNKAQDYHNSVQDYGLGGIFRSILKIAPKIIPKTIPKKIPEAFIEGAVNEGINHAFGQDYRRGNGGRRPGRRPGKRSRGKPRGKPAGKPAGKPEGKPKSNWLQRIAGEVFIGGANELGGQAVRHGLDAFGSQGQQQEPQY